MWPWVARAYDTHANPTTLVPKMGLWKRSMWRSSVSVAGWWLLSTSQTARREIDLASTETIFRRDFPLRSGRRGASMLLQCTQQELMVGLRAAAAIEAMYTDQDWLRRYHYVENLHPGIDPASFDNGGGDEMQILFCSHGVMIKGFDHESPVTPYARDDHSPWPRIFDGVPAPFLLLLEDPTIRKDDLTFLHWLPAGAKNWCRGPVTFPEGEDDGSGWLLPLLPLTAQGYIETAEQYWGKDFGKVDRFTINECFGR